LPEKFKSGMARIYQAPVMGEAQIRIAIVSNRAEADLLVCKVDSYGMAIGDALWYITRDKENATCRVYFTSVGMAQINIYMVTTRGEAGWQRAHPLKGRFK
jgi:hypothetical protein